MRRENNNRKYGFSTPLTCSWFFSVIGAEYSHAYFWIFKDLAWMQGWISFSVCIGLSTLLWSILILRHAIRTLNWHEIWHFVGLFFWLFANFWWMVGEAHDYKYPNAPPISQQHTYGSSIVLQVALIWQLFYYLVIIPTNALPENILSLMEYDDGQLKSRLPCLKNFRQYENLHMLFWIAKDLAWNINNLQLWLLCLVPTIIIAADFLFISATAVNVEDSTVDTVHFLVVLLWVIGNSVWAFGDFFVHDFDAPQHMLDSSADSFKTARWYSSWILFISLIPIISMYVVWLYLTINGRLKSNRASLNSFNGINNFESAGLLRVSTNDSCLPTLSISSFSDPASDE
eukprot:gene7643-10403_t